MLVFSISDFNENATKILNAAQKNEVIINNEGKQYKILPINNDVNKGKSPLENIPRTKLNISTQEIVEILHENRAGI